MHRSDEVINKHKMQDWLKIWGGKEVGFTYFV